MRITSKGQVTVPKHIRDRADMPPGADVEFVMENGRVVLFRRQEPPNGETRGERLVRMLCEAGRRAAHNDLSADEILEMTRGPYDDVYVD
jgi:antitoxin PrlF